MDEKQSITIIIPLVTAIGQILSVINPTTIFSGSTIIYMGLAFSVILIAWGLLAWKSANNLVSKVSKISFVLGIVAIIYFIIVFLVIIFVDRPLFVGKLIQDTTDKITLKNYGTQNELIGQYSLKLDKKLDKKSDKVEIIFSPHDKVRALVDRIVVMPLSHSRKVDTLVRHDPKEAGLMIESPYNPVDVRVYAFLLKDKNDIDMIVHYRYGKTDKVWRIKRWIFQHYG